MRCIPAATLRMLVLSREKNIQIECGRAAFDFIATWPAERSLNFRSTIMMLIPVQAAHHNEMMSPAVTE